MSYMNVGFTGTQHGMTPKQQDELRQCLTILRDQHEALIFHHGDCVGADAEADAIARELGYHIVLHPPTNPKKRAFCQADYYTCAPKSYLTRNQDIVLDTGVLLAAPRERVEEQRSGTWATVRFARRARVFYPVWIIWP